MAEGGQWDPGRSKALQEVVDCLHWQGPQIGVRPPEQRERVRATGAMAYLQKLNLNDTQLARGLANAADVDAIASRVRLALGGWLNHRGLNRHRFPAWADIRQQYDALHTTARNKGDDPVDLEREMGIGIPITQLEGSGVVTPMEPDEYGIPRRIESTPLSIPEASDTVAITYPTLEVGKAGGTGDAATRRICCVDAIRQLVHGEAPAGLSEEARARCMDDVQFCRQMIREKDEGGWIGTGEAWTRIAGKKWGIGKPRPVLLEVSAQGPSSGQLRIRW